MPPTPEEPHNLEVVRQYLAAIEQNDDATLERILHADIVQEEYPNILVPHGARHDRAAMLTRFAQGKKLMTAQRYELLSAMASGDSVAIEVQWSGTLAVPFGEKLPAGSVMRARFAMFFGFRDGQIVSIRNYDCIEPW
jgi:ketosteroid isomerase-like protein